MHAVDVSQADFEEQVVKASFKQSVAAASWQAWLGLLPVTRQVFDEC